LQRIVARHHLLLSQTPHLGHIHPG
jgi:hypothetical protein